MRISRRSAPAAFVAALASLLVLAGHSPAPDDRLVYVWSRGMPLSVDGLPEAEAAAKALGVRFVARNLEDVHAAAHPDRSLPPEVAGSDLHVPSATLVRVVDGEDQVRTVLGYKHRDALVRALATAAVVRPPVDRGTAADAPADASPLHPSEIRWVGEPEPGYPGFFYRMIPGTTQFVLDRRGRTWVHDTDTGARWQGPAEIDLVPSPDAAFLVAPLDRGLAFYSWEELRRVGPEGGGADLPPFHLDPDMDDQYPSVGILGAVDGGTRVRILVSWFAGVRVRDYVVSRTGDGGLGARPITDVVRPCPDVRLSTPILSPDGHRVSGRDEATGTTKVFEIGASGARCDEVVDVGTGTSKATFSPSSDYLTFSRWDALGGRRLARVHVLDLTTGEVRALREATSTRLLIPDFGTEDEILILGVRDAPRFEIHCWRGTCPP